MRNSLSVIVILVGFFGCAADSVRACARDGTDGPCQCAQRAVQLANSLWTPAAPSLAGRSLDLAPRDPQVQAVTVFDFGYSDATIHVGDTVQWQWLYGSHDVHSVEGSAEVFASDFFSGSPENPPTFVHTFTHAGTFWYYCTAHGFDNLDGTASLMANFVTVLDVVQDTGWHLDADGNWSVDANWGGGTAPNGVDQIARFISGITAPRTVSVDVPRTVGAIGFESPVSYTIAGPATITLDVSAGDASIGVSAGSHAISAPMVLNDNTTIAVNDAASTLTISGNVTATGKSIIKTGYGAVQMENIRAAGLTVVAGTVRVRARGAANATGGASTLTSLSVYAGAQLDLADNSLAIDYPGLVGTLLDDTRQNLEAARIFSSAADASHRLGYKDTGDELDIKFAYAGDANLDGKVDAVDLGALASHWQQSGVWTGGDLDYNGFVDIRDLYLLASTWQLGAGNPLPSSSLATALAGMGLGNVVVPEPGSIALVAFGVAAVWRRRPVFVSQSSSGR